MFSLFKRKAPETPREQTFKTRVADFWKWYAGASDRIYRAVDGREMPPELISEVSARVGEMQAGFAWVFGPGADGKGHSLTISGEGNPHKQLLAAFCVAQAPKLDGWTFHSARQSTPNPGLNTIKIAGVSLDPQAFWLTPAVNEERQRIDLTVWHPVFPQLPDGARWTVLFLFLDEALGEIGTQNWIGEIEMNDTKLAGALPLAELRAYTERVQADHEWKKGGPGEIWTLYRGEGDNPEMPRGDVFVGTTCSMRLIQEFGDAEGQLEDPLAGSGADYVYVAFDANILPKGQEADGRGEMEDALNAALASTASGQHLGGAMGNEFAYIDLLLFDGAESIRLVLETLRRLRLPSGTSLNYFAHEKRGHRIVI